VATANQALFCSRFDGNIILRITSFILEKIDEDYFDDFPVCFYTKKLDFEWDQLDETHDLLPKITKMIPFFPNLIRMVCYFEAEQYTSEQVIRLNAIIYLNE
jgi:hypothetical protein